MKLINSILSELLIHSSEITLCFKDTTKRNLRVVKVESAGKDNSGNNVVITGKELLGVFKFNSANIESITCYQDNKAIILLQGYYWK